MDRTRRARVSSRLNPLLAAVVTVALAMLGLGCPPRGSELGADDSGACSTFAGTRGTAPCEPRIEIRMAPSSPDFFGMPWPSDHRRNPDGTLKLSGYPKGADVLGLAQEIMDVGQPATVGFGTNTAVFFTTTGDLDPASFPPPERSHLDDSPVMLANLETGERVPVLVDYKSDAGAARPEKLLAVLPYPGFSLEPKSRYAVILFDDLAGVDYPVGPSPLLSALRQGARTQTGLSIADFELLGQAQRDVDAYVRARTAHDPSQVVAFSVYTTQAVEDTFVGAGNAVLALSDDEIVSRVVGAEVVRACQPCAGAGVCDPAVLAVTLDVPQFQTPLQVEQNLACLLGLGHCLVTAGGDISLDPRGYAQIQRWEEGVKAEVLVPCAAEQPAQGWGQLVRVDGTGSDHRAVEVIANWYRRAGRPFNQVGISMTPFQSGDRLDPALTAQIVNSLAGLGISVDPQAVSGLVAYFVLNPVFVRNNGAQGAAEQLYLKRVLGLLERIASQSGISAADLGLAGLREPFRTDPENATLSSHSQGSSISPLAASWFEPPHGFRNLQLNAGSGLTHEIVVHRANIRPIFETLLSVGPDELDHFHPGLHLVQTFIEAGDLTNYARILSSENVLVTSGAIDGCSPREGTIAFAAALQRAGKLTFADTTSMFASGPPPEWVDSVRVLESLSEPSSVRATLPIRANLGRSGTGAFLHLPGAHDMYGTQAMVGAFLSDLGRGASPTIAAPPYEHEELFLCGPRTP